MEDDRNIAAPTSTTSTPTTRAPPRATIVERVENYEVGFFDYFGLDYLFNEIFVGLEYHFETDQRAPFIIDCGSNIGMSILFFKTRYPDAEILGFEPSAQAFAQLQENVNRNLLRDVRVLPVAVSDTEGTIDFFIDPDAPGSLARWRTPASDIDFGPAGHRQRRRQPFRTSSYRRTARRRVRSRSAPDHWLHVGGQLR